jgi:hypothetical protein
VYTLAVPNVVPAGQYELLVGLYRPEPGERLQLTNHGDTLVLGSIAVMAKIK